MENFGNAHTQRLNNNKKSIIVKVT